MLCCAWEATSHSVRSIVLFASSMCRKYSRPPPTRASSVMATPSPTAVMITRRELLNNGLTFSPARLLAKVVLENLELFMLYAYTTI